VDKIKEHFEEEARDFDRIILTLIPECQRMVEALIAALPFDSPAPIELIDLGCGVKH
jgi:tRNA (cmo5U34)-methyltransferase